MKSRDVVGKKIVAIRQGVWSQQQGANINCWTVEALVLEDGTELRFTTVEGEGEYGTNIVVIKRKTNVPRA